MKLAFRALLLYACFLPFLSFAQTATIDSLKALLPEMNEDSTKAILLTNIANRLTTRSPDEGLEFAKRSLDLATKLDYPKGIAQAYYIMSWAELFKGDYELGLQYANIALDNALIREDHQQLSLLHNLIGAIKLNTGDTEGAVVHMFESVKLSEQLGNWQVSLSVYSNIGEIYQTTTDFVSARKYYLKGLALAKKFGAKPSEVLLYSNLANVTEQKEEKLDFLKKAISLGDSIGDSRGLAYSYATLGDTHWETRDAPEALKAYRNGLAFARKSGDQKIFSYCHVFIGPVFLEMGLIDSALYYLRYGHDYAVSSGQMDYEYESAYNLSKAFAQQKDYRTAFEWLDKSHTLYDTLYRQRTAQAATDADARFEVSKKEAQLAEQQLEIAQQKNQRNQIIIGGLLLLTLIAAIFQYFFYRQKRKKQAIELALKAELTEAERLRQLDEFKTQFFTNVSHELRTPLTLIISPLEESLKKLKQVGLEHDLKLAHRNSKNLLGLVNEVLDLAKLEAGKLETHEVEIAIVSLLRRVFFSFQSGADLKGVALDFKVDFLDELLVTIDTSKLEKILNNLLANALKFTPKGGEISLIGQQVVFESGYFELTVADTGRGISAKDLPNIFGRFFQAPRDAAAIESGTGIGLALAKELAKLMGGDLRVSSEVDQGSQFTLSLPLAYQEMVGDLAETQRGQKTNPEVITEAKSTVNATLPFFQPLFIKGQKPKLLIVEDHLEMSKYLADSLSENYDCTVATDGKEALEQLGNQHFDLITSDVMMPNMDGFKLREQINRQEEWKRIPFILLTARSLETDKLKGFQLGVDDYITKPFSLPELEARIHNLLKNKVLRDQWADQEVKSGEEMITAEDQIIKDAEALVLEKLDDIDFSVEVMAKDLGFSSRHLSRVFGKIVGLSPVQFILEIRLQKARQLLESQQFATVSEVRYEVGIESASYFTRKFTERFGKNPRAYLK